MTAYSYSCDEALTAIDAGVALEFFAEYVSTADALTTAFRFVGHSGTGYGFKLKEVQEVFYQNLEAEDSWSFKIEDYLKQATVNNLLLRVHNTESRDLSVLITETVRGVGTFTLLTERFAGKSFIDFVVFPRLLTPVRQSDSVTKSFHTVLITSNEESREATVVISLNGWVTWPTKLPALGPLYP